MFKAKDIMTQNVVTVSTSTEIYDAMNLLIKHNITGLPVLDDNALLVGVLSEKDMLNLLYNEKLKDNTVGHFMTKNPVSFGPEDNVVDICDCFLENSFRRVLIVENSKLIGIISRRDIIKFILKIRNKKK